MMAPVLMSRPTSEERVPPGPQTRHPAFLEAELGWSRIADALAGTDAVRFNASRYIPPLKAFAKDAEFANAYMDRAVWEDFPSRAVDAMIGESSCDEFSNRHLRGTVRVGNRIVPGV